MANEDKNLPLPEEDILPIENIASDIHGLRILFVNVFAVTNPDGSWTLIDAGVPFSAARTRGWAMERFHQPPKAIVLTHGHFDHAGGVRTLADDWNVPVYAHSLEFPFLTGQESYPRPDPGVGGGVMPLLSPLFPRSPYDISDRLRLIAGETLDVLPGWRVMHTPGHTQGHVSFFRESDRALIVGDAFCTCNQNSFFSVAQQKPELTGPPWYFTPDWNSARNSVEKLAALQPALIIPGHGRPMIGADLPQRLQKLAEEFDRYAKPDHGKYVSEQKESAA